MIAEWPRNLGIAASGTPFMTPVVGKRVLEGVPAEVRKGRPCPAADEHGSRLAHEERAAIGPMIRWEPTRSGARTKPCCTRGREVVRELRQRAIRPAHQLRQQPQSGGRTCSWSTSRL